MAYATWNPSDKNANIVLSGGNLIATDGSDAWSGVRANIGVSTGKWYWEITITLLSNDFMVGAARAAQSLSNDGTGSQAYSYYTALTSHYKVYASNVSYGAAFATGDVVGIALDLDNGTIEFFLNGASQGVAFTGISADTYFPWFNSYQAAQIATANFGASAFAYSVPSGFNPGIYTADVPVLDTDAVTDILDVSATGNGSIDDVGSGGVDERGFVWDEASHGDPGNVSPASSDYADAVTESGSFSTGAYTGALSSLTPATTYYVRAYAHNGDGYAYGDEVSFETEATPPFRFANLPGITFDPDDDVTIFAERLNDMLERIEALEDA